MAATQEAPPGTGAPADLADAVKAMNAIASEVKGVVIESDELVDALILGIASKTHVYVAGSGGVGKTFATEQIAEHFGVTHFYIQFRNDTKREEVFGPLSMTALQQDRYEHVMRGYIGEAHIATLDEFKDGARFTRQLLNILNERWMVNGGVRLTVPLISAVGATNFWIEEHELEALFDRFAQRLVQEPVKTSAGFKKILQGQRARATGVSPKLTMISLEQLTAVHDAVNACAVPDDILEEVDKLRLSAQAENLAMSPRRWGMGVELACAAAVLAGEGVVTEDHLRVFRRVLPNHPDDFTVARDLCKGFRDKYTEAIEEAQRALAEISEITDPIRQALARGEEPDTAPILTVPKRMRELRARIVQAQGSNAGRDQAPLDGVLAQLAEHEQLVHRVVMGQ